MFYSCLQDYTFGPEKMNLDPKECKIMLTEPPMNPVANRKKLVTAMFELYGFSYCNVSIQAMLTLYAQGLLTGCVVDTGDGVTHVVPVYEGPSGKLTRWSWLCSALREDTQAVQTLPKSSKTAFVSPSFSSPLGTTGSCRRTSSAA